MGGQAGTARAQWDIPRSIGTFRARLAHSALDWHIPRSIGTFRARLAHSALDWHIPRSIGTFRAQSSAIQHMSSATRRAQRIAPEYESEEIRSLVCGDADRRRSRGAKSISNVLASRIASNLITVTS